MLVRGGSRNPFTRPPAERHSLLRLKCHPQLTLRVPPSALGRPARRATMKDRSSRSLHSPQTGSAQAARASPFSRIGRDTDQSGSRTRRGSCGRPSMATAGMPASIARSSASPASSAPVSAPSTLAHAACVGRPPPVASGGATTGSLGWGLHFRGAGEGLCCGHATAGPRDRRWTWRFSMTP